MSKRLLLYLLLGLALAFTTGCGGTGEQPAAGSLPGSELAGTSWQATSLAGDVPMTGSQITVAFSDGEISGSTGCNRYGGEYRVDGQSLDVSGFFVTEMACLDPDGIMQQEERYVTLLNQVESFFLLEDALQLITADGQALTFAPQLPQ